MIKVGPDWGNGAIFRRLVADAHRLSLKVVLDVVVSHAVIQDLGYDRCPASTRSRAAWVTPSTLTGRTGSVR